MVRIQGPSQQPQRPEDKPGKKSEKKQQAIPKDLLSAIHDNPDAPQILKGLFGVNVPKDSEKLLDALEGENPKLVKALNDQKEKFPEAINELSQGKGLGAAKHHKKPAAPAKHHKEIEDTPPSPHTAPNPKGYAPDYTPLGPLPPGASPEMQAIHQLLEQLQGMPSWFNNWPGGKLPLSPADMEAQITKLQAMAAKIPASDPRHTAIEAQIAKYKPALDAYNTFASQKIDGSNFELQDLVFGNTESTWGSLTGGKYTSIVAVWNAAAKGDTTAQGLLTNLVGAVGKFTAKNAQGQPLTGFAAIHYLCQQETIPAPGEKESPQTIVMNNLCSYSSIAFSDLLCYIVENPTSGIDTSWISNDVTSNFAAGFVRSAIAANIQTWITYLTAHGHSKADATSIANSLTTIYSAQATAVFLKYHAIPGATAPNLQQILKDLLPLVHMTEPPSSAFTSQRIPELITLAQLFGPIYAEIAQFKKTLNSDKSGLGQGNYQLENSLAYLLSVKPPTPAATALASIIEDAIKTGKKGVPAIAVIFSALASELAATNTLGGSALTSIFGTPPTLPPNLQTDASAIDSSFKTETSNSTPAYATLQAALNSVAALINGHGPGTLLVDKIDAIYPQLANGLPPGNKTHYKPFPGSGTSIWFDTSFVEGKDPVACFKKYLENCFANGVKEMKLSFGTFSDDPGSGNTLVGFIKAIGGLGNAESMAKQYGITLSISVGGQNAAALHFPGGMSAADFADKFYNEYLKGTGAVDFDLEGAGLASMIGNGQANVTAFFSELAKKLHANGQQLQLTVAGSITAIKPLEYLFKLSPPIIDRINLMLYDSGTSYYISKGTKGGDPSKDKNDYGIDYWIDMLVKDMGISPAKAISMLGIDFQDATPYESKDPSVTRGGSDPYQATLEAEIAARTGIPITQMSRGQAANEIRQQLLIDVKKDYGITDPSANFAPQSWWIDENRMGDKGTGDLQLFAESEAATNQLTEILKAEGINV